MCFLSQNLVVLHSLLERQSGCCGVWCLTTRFLCRTPEELPVRSWCPCGLSLLWSFWPATLPTWQLSWSRRSMSTRSQASATKRCTVITTGKLILMKMYVHVLCNIVPLAFSQTNKPARICCYFNLLLFFFLLLLSFSFSSRDLMTSLLRSALAQCQTAAQSETSVITIRRCIRTWWSSISATWMKLCRAWKLGQNQNSHLSCTPSLT